MREAATIVIPAKAGIQYSRGLAVGRRSRGVLDRPVKPGDDGGINGKRGHHAASALWPSHCPTRASGSAFWVTSLTTAMESAPAAKISADCSNLMPPIATSGILPIRFFHSVIFGIPCGAKHLHLGQEDLADADLAEIRKAGLTLGISTHDDEELATALAAKPDYIALGPIFPTTLKSMRFAPQGIPKITEWKKRIGNIPLVAIGGIKFEQSAEIFAAGADSIAVVSDVTQNADPDARVRQWLGHSAGAA